MIRVGIVGFGKMGRIRYESLQPSAQASVVAIADPNPKMVMEGVRSYGTASELLEDTEVDAVFICTPNRWNQQFTIEALRAGKHVFCEKPPAFNAEQVEEVIAAERSCPGLKLMYGLNHRHHESMRKARELIDSGVYGKILWMRGRYGKSVDPSFYDDWRSRRELAGGGIMMDQGIHMLDLFLMMAGDFDEVHAFVSNLYWKLDVEDNVFAILRSRNGVVASLHSTMTQWRHLFSLEIFLEHGSIVVNGLLTSSGTYGDEMLTATKNRTAAPAAAWSDEEHFQFTANNSWRYEAEHFLNAIDRNVAVEVGTSGDALKLMTLLDKIYQGAKL